MSVGAGYDGVKVEPVIRDGVIRVTHEWAQAHAADRSPEAEELLFIEQVGVSVCPRTYTFNDTAEVRRVLGLPPAEV
jgi:hypothetical protein